MLKVVAEEVAGHKGPNVIERLTAGVVRRVVMLAPVRQVGTEKEQLESTQNGGSHPENYQIFPGKSQFQQIVADGHEQNLFPGNVLFQKTEIPGKEIGVALVKIRVVESTRMLMVQVMLAVKDAVVIESKERRRQPAHGAVEPGSSGGHHAVNGVMGRDEHARVQVHLNQHEQVHQRIPKR